jgi:hypothetical protein
MVIHARAAIAGTGMGLNSPTCTGPVEGGVVAATAAADGVAVDSDFGASDFVVSFFAVSFLAVSFLDEDDFSAPEEVWDWD